MELSPGELAQVFANLAATTARSNETIVAAEKSGGQAQNVQAAEYKNEMEEAEKKKGGGVFSTIGRALGTAGGFALAGPVGAGVGGELGGTLGGGVDTGELNFDAGEFAKGAIIGTGVSAVTAGVGDKLAGMGKGAQAATKLPAGELGTSATGAGLVQPAPLQPGTAMTPVAGGGATRTLGSDLKEIFNFMTTPTDTGLGTLGKQGMAGIKNPDEDEELI